MTASPDSTVGAIVSKDFRAAAVFDRFGIDFCCGGRRTLSEACRERSVDVSSVVHEVELACGSPTAEIPRFGEWGPEALVAYIVANHHAYVRRAMPRIAARAAKVVASHGARHPELGEIVDVFNRLAEEMTSHMAIEERVLFPYILELVEAERLENPLPAARFGSIEDPIGMMEIEHESAGGAMAWIRSQTGDYRPPIDACPTWRVWLQELEAFERDLHVHVHLENNLLFPKAKALARRI